jgi:hypothetical protein
MVLGISALLDSKIIPFQIGNPPPGFIKPGTLGVFPNQAAVIIQGGADIPLGTIRLQELAVKPPGLVAPGGVGFPELIQDRKS